MKSVTSGQRLHHARGVGNKVVLCRSAILCVLFLCYNTSWCQNRDGTPETA